MAPAEFSDHVIAVVKQVSNLDGMVTPFSVVFGVLLLVVVRAEDFFFLFVVFMDEAAAAAAGLLA